MKRIAFAIFLVSISLTFGCNNGGNKLNNAEKKLLFENEKNGAALERLNKKYPFIPDDKILENNGQNSAVYTELKARYKEQLKQLKEEVEATGAKFVVMMVTMEDVSGVSNWSKYGEPYIVAACKELGIECFDFIPDVMKQDKTIITLYPRDGHWSKKGAEYFANLLKPILQKYETNRCTTHYKDSERPETYGDLPPNDDELLDGGKQLTYRVQANAQGLRMNHAVTFPKTKFRTLFLGGSYVYSPFIDNEFISTVLLEKMLPEAEVLNSGMISGTVDDYLSLWREKAKYCEPDLVIMHTNGGDITDLYFTNRNHLARSHKPYYPTPTEESYYSQMYVK